MITAADIAAIGVAQADLDLIDNQLTSAIEAIENILRERVSTRVEIAVENESFSKLAFGKNSGAWRFIVVFGGDHEQPLVSASRGIRAQALAAGHIERLVTEAASLIRSQVAGRKAAIDAANHLLHTLTTQQGA